MVSTPLDFLLALDAFSELQTPAAVTAATTTATALTQAVTSAAAAVEVQVDVASVGVLNKTVCAFQFPTKAGFIIYVNLSSSAPRGPVILK